MCADELRGAISGTIINDNDFDRLPEFLFERSQTCLQIMQAIIGDNDNANVITRIKQVCDKVIRQSERSCQKRKYSEITSAQPSLE